MLNYIWAGLIAFALLFALINDGRDLSRDTFRNGKSLPVAIKPKSPSTQPQRLSDVEIVIDAETYAQHFGVRGKLAASYPATLITTESGQQLRFPKGQDFPEPLLTIRDTTGGDDKELRASVIGAATSGDGSIRAGLKFEPARFAKLRAMTAEAFAQARNAVDIALRLIGVLSLWLGLMYVGEATGLVKILVAVVQPILRPLFPGIPKGHPALGMVAMNLAANMLGLGNAATPFGLKAMEELQKLNPTDDTATDPMVMLLALNTAGVQLVPSASLVAIIGFGAAEIFFPVLIVTFLCAVIAALSTKLLGRLPMYRRTNPNLNPPMVVTKEGGAA